VTHLRKNDVGGTPTPNLSPITARIYLRAVEEFAQYYNQPPDRLGPKHIRQYQAHPFTDRKLDAISVAQQLSALRFFFLKTLKRPWIVEDLPVPSRSAYRRSSRGKKWNGSSNTLTDGHLVSTMVDFARASSQPSISVWAGSAAYVAPFAIRHFSKSFRASCHLRNSSVSCFSKRRLPSSSGVLGAFKRSRSCWESWRNSISAAEHRIPALEFLFTRSSIPSMASLIWSMSLDMRT
jgi:hypothetical protein